LQCKSFLNIWSYKENYGFWKITESLIEDTEEKGKSKKDDKKEACLIGISMQWTLKSAEA